MNDVYRYEHCRLNSKLKKLLFQYSNLGYRLTSVKMSDLETRFELIFKKEIDLNIKYVYAHEKCRLSSKVNRYLDEYSNKGWEMVFHVRSDLGTRHELFFEKQEKIK